MIDHFFIGNPSIPKRLANNKENLVDRSIGMGIDSIPPSGKYECSVKSSRRKIRQNNVCILCGTLTIGSWVLNLEQTQGGNEFRGNFRNVRMESV